MKKSVNLILAIHQPFRLRNFRFFDIGTDHYYYDDYANESVTAWLARKSYLPATSLLLRMLSRYGDQFKFGLYVSGCALDLLRSYAPSAVESLKKLSDTGNVEFLGGTWAHSPAALVNQTAFNNQVALHREEIRKLSGQQPSTFFSPEMLYSDTMGELYRAAGFHSTLVEGSAQVLGWRSPDMLYGNAVSPEFKLHMTNTALSGTLARITEKSAVNSSPNAGEILPLLEKSGAGEQVVNLYLDMEFFGIQWDTESGVFALLEDLIHRIVESDILEFTTPAESARRYPPASLLSIPHPAARADEERNILALNGNEIQREAMEKLFGLTNEMCQNQSSDIFTDWIRLQSSDHFLYMASHYYDREPAHRPNPWNAPHEAFINYMNIVSDLKIRAGFL
jgi:alpha-amylase